MEEIVFKADRRDVTGKQVKALRRQGRLPAVLYGYGIDPILITLDLREAGRIIPTITSSHLVVVDVDGDRHTTLVREKQRHPVQGSLQHVDFLVVSMTETLHADVIIELVGEAPAVKDFSAVLVQALERVEVESLPADLPERIVVDLSVLKNIGDTVHVRDLNVGARVQVLTDPDEVVAIATAPEAEEAPAVAVEEGAPEPEVIDRGWKQEEEEF